MTTRERTTSLGSEFRIRDAEWGTDSRAELRPRGRRDTGRNRCRLRLRVPSALVLLGRLRRRSSSRFARRPDAGLWLGIGAMSALPRKRAPIRSSIATMNANVAAQHLNLSQLSAVDKLPARSSSASDGALRMAGSDAAETPVRARGSTGSSGLPRAAPRGPGRTLAVYGVRSWLPAIFVGDFPKLVHTNVCDR